MRLVEVIDFGCVACLGRPHQEQLSRSPGAWSRRLTSTSGFVSRRPWRLIRAETAGEEGTAVLTPSFCRRELDRRVPRACPTAPRAPFAATGRRLRDRRADHRPEAGMIARLGHGPGHYAGVARTSGGGRLPEPGRPPGPALPGWPCCGGNSPRSDRSSGQPRTGCRDPNGRAACELVRS
jgi:hypothetical protein